MMCCCCCATVYRRRGKHGGWMYSTYCTYEVVGAANQKQKGGWGCFFCKGRQQTVNASRGMRGYYEVGHVYLAVIMVRKKCCGNLAVGSSKGTPEETNKERASLWYIGLDRHKRVVYVFIQSSGGDSKPCEVVD